MQKESFFHFTVGNWVADLRQFVNFNHDGAQVFYGFKAPPALRTLPMNLDDVSAVVTPRRGA